VAARLSLDHKPSYLRDFVYGAIDGSVTTFVIVFGAGLSGGIIIILGFATLPPPVYCTLKPNGKFSGNMSISGNSWLNMSKMRADISGRR
jgi:hypothetical protein